MTAISVLVSLVTTERVLSTVVQVCAAHRASQAGSSGIANHARASVRPLTGNDNIDVDATYADLPSLILHAIACRDKPLPDRPIGVTPPRQPGSSATGDPRPATPSARGGVCAGSAEQIISSVTVQTADRLSRDRCRRLGMRGSAALSMASTSGISPALEDARGAD